MTAAATVELLLRQITALPEMAQTELAQALLEMHAEQLGIFPPEDKPARSYEESA
jgi:hypothetical protein